MCRSGAPLIGQVVNNLRADWLLEVTRSLTRQSISYIYLHDSLGFSIYNCQRQQQHVDPSAAQVTPWSNQDL